MELLKVVKRRSLLSEVIYILLNVGLAFAVLAVTWATGTPWLGLLLVLLSKWRVFAVRPRYWIAHIEANLVDVIVGIGLVTLIYLVGQSGSAQAVPVQVVLAILYGAWLLFLKPRTRRNAVSLQAAVAMVVGTMALASISYEWPSSAFVITMWIIGFSCARHVLVAYSEEETRLLSLVWGFIVAEIAWLGYHWTIAYTLPFAGGLKLPQVTLLVLGISFLAERVYNSYHKHGIVRTQDVMLPMLLVLGVMLILLTLFNAASIGAV